MTFRHKTTGIIAILAITGLAACGGGSRGSMGSGSFSGGKRTQPAKTGTFNSDVADETRRASAGEGKSSLFDIFKNNPDANTTVGVNKYIWNASLEVLNFLPIESVDPFTGVIVTGYGTPPGGGRAYKATIYVQDPALDARSLNISLRTRGGVVSADTIRAVEDAILTRARQLRIRDGKL
ncbi:DUF3576 domain-containing protein [Profundibacter sp.]